MAGKLVAASCRCECWLLLRGCVCRWAAARPRFVVPSMREPAARSGRSRSPAKPSDPPAPSTQVGFFIAVHIPSRPRRPRAPPPSPTARSLLSRSSRVALHTGGAWCVLVGDRRRFEARLCPAAAPGYRRQAPQPGLSRPAAHVSPSTPAVPGVCWWVIGVVLKPGYAPPLPPDTAVGHQPGAVCPALVSNLARSGVCSMRT